MYTIFSAALGLVSLYGRKEKNEYFTLPMEIEYVYCENISILLVSRDCIVILLCFLSIHRYRFIQMQVYVFVEK